MAKRYVCEALTKDVKLARHTCAIRSVATVSAPRAYPQGFEYPAIYARHFRNREWFDNHKKKMHAKNNNSKSAYEIRKRCVTCGAL